MVNSLCSLTRSLQCNIPTGNRRVITFADDTVIYIIILLRQWFFFIKLTAKANVVVVADFMLKNVVAVFSHS